MRSREPLCTRRAATEQRKHGLSDRAHCGDRGPAVVLLMVQSIGDMPSEPLGGGPTRELVIGVGRPLILFLVGVGIMIIGQPRAKS